MIARPDVHNDQKIWDQIQPDIFCAFIFSGENCCEAGAVKPGHRVDANEKKNQPALAKQARSRQKQRTWRRIHEIVFPRVKEIDFMACEDMLAGFVPKFVIKESAAPEVAQKRKS